LLELKTAGLFLVTALAEIVGCYLPYLWLREGKTVWLLVPGALSLAAFPQRCGILQDLLLH